MPSSVDAKAPRSPVIAQACQELEAREREERRRPGASLRVSDRTHGVSGRVGDRPARTRPAHCRKPGPRRGGARRPPSRPPRCAARSTRPREPKVAKLADRYITIPPIVKVAALLDDLEAWNASRAK